MERIQELLNFTNADGSVKMIHIGSLSITLTQLLLTIGLVVILLVALKVTRGVLKLFWVVGFIAVFLVTHGVLSPIKLGNTVTQLSAAGIKSYQSLANASDNIKIEDSTIKIKVKRDWIDVKDIDSFMVGDENTITIIVGDKYYTTDDLSVIQLIKSFK